MSKRSKRDFALYVRNFIFGVEDSLVSTVGLLSGIAWAGVNKETIFLTGTVLIFVEAFSMGTGSFLSEHSAEEYEQQGQGIQKAISASIVMFLSYFVTGFIPLLPYLIFPKENAFFISIGFSLASLFLLGWISAKILRRPATQKAIEMFFIGGAAIVAGILVGNIVNKLQSQ